MKADRSGVTCGRHEFKPRIVAVARSDIPSTRGELSTSSSGSRGRGSGRAGRHRGGVRVAGARDPITGEVARGSDRDGTGRDGTRRAPPRDRRSAGGLADNGRLCSGSPSARSTYRRAPIPAGEPGRSAWGLGRPGARAPLPTRLRRSSRSWPAPIFAPFAPTGLPLRTKWRLS